MDPTRLMTRTCTITHRSQDGTPDQYGNPTITTTTESALCEFQQQQRSENTLDADRQTEAWVLYVEPDAELHGSDQVTIDGAVYEVDGPPWRARNPRTQEETHIEARVRRVT